MVSLVIGLVFLGVGVRRFFSIKAVDRSTTGLDPRILGSSARVGQNTLIEQRISWSRLSQEQGPFLRKTVGSRNSVPESGLYLLHSARLEAPRLLALNFHPIIAHEARPRDDHSNTHCFRVTHFLWDDTRYLGGSRGVLWPM